MAEKTLVLLDTDIGNDIDDAVALAYLLMQPKAELLGVTTVTGDVQQRAALCEILCKEAGKPDIPIHCGRREVLWRGPGQPWVPHYEKVSHLPHSLNRPENTAVDFLRETIRAHPGDVVLLSVGPFGNIANLFSIDPEIPSLLKGYVSMAGRFFPEPGHEWNCIVDPLATSIVSETQFQGQLWVGLDVTLQCQMSQDQVRERFTHPLLKVVALMAESWFEHRPEITFHDPLAAAMIFNHGLCRLAQGLVHVPLPDEDGKGGVTHFTPDDGPHRVALDVNVQSFFEEYFSVFN